MNEKLWWYVARSSGIVSWALLTASVVWGLGVSTRLTAKRPPRGWLLDLHRFLGGLAVVFTGCHLAGLVLDSYVSFGAVEILVPFTSAWRPGAVAWGVVALYLLLAVEVTSLLMRRLPRTLWKRVHQSGLVLYGVATAHFVTAGTDIGNPLVQWTVLLSSAAVLFLLLFRVLAPRARPKPRAAGPTAAAHRAAVPPVADPPVADPPVADPPVADPPVAAAVDPDRAARVAAARERAAAARARREAAAATADSS